MTALASSFQKIKFHIFFEGLSTSILRKTFKIKLETSFAKVRIFNFRLEKSIKIIDIAISLTVTQSKRIGLSAHVKSQRSDFKQKSELWKNNQLQKPRNKISYARLFVSKHWIWMVLWCSYRWNRLEQSETPPTRSSRARHGMRRSPETTPGRYPVPTWPKTGFLKNRFFETILRFELRTATGSHS